MILLPYSKRVAIGFLSKIFADQINQLHNNLIMHRRSQICVINCRSFFSGGTSISNLYA